MLTNEDRAELRAIDRAERLARLAETGRLSEYRDWTDSEVVAGYLGCRDRSDRSVGRAVTSEGPTVSAANRIGRSRRAAGTLSRRGYAVSSRTAVR